MKILVNTIFKVKSEIIDHTVSTQFIIAVNPKLNSY